MRIPPSVIVMSLLCAVPFGLAIRDANKGRDKIGGGHHYDDDEDDGPSPDPDVEAREVENYREAEAQADKIRAEEREQKAKLAADQAKMAPKLVGPEPASLGTLFTGVRLGAGAGNFQPDEVRQAIADASSLLEVEWDVDASHLNGVTVTLKTEYGDSNCAALARAVSAWGPKTGEGWENAATHQRATFDEYGCSVKIDRFADLEHWIDRSDASVVPLTAIGQSAAKLRARVADRLDDEQDDALTWHDVGLAGGKGPTRITALIENGKVVTLSVELPDSADLAPILGRITKLAGTKGKHDDDEFTTTWKGGRLDAIVYENIPSLVIGKR
jgi:hypothetical protein